MRFQGRRCWPICGPPIAGDRATRRACGRWLRAKNIRQDPAAKILTTPLTGGVISLNLGADRARTRHLLPICLTQNKEAPLIYTISYSTPLPSAVALHAKTAARALKIAREIAGRGNAPTIEHDGQKFSLREFETIVGSVRFGNDA